MQSDLKEVVAVDGGLKCKSTITVNIWYSGLHFSYMHCYGSCVLFLSVCGCSVSPCVVSEFLSLCTVLVPLCIFIIIFVVICLTTVLLLLFSIILFWKLIYSQSIVVVSQHLRLSPAPQCYLFQWPLHTDTMKSETTTTCNCTKGLAERDTSDANLSANVVSSLGNRGWQALPQCIVVFVGFSAW